MVFWAQLLNALAEYRLGHWDAAADWAAKMRANPNAPEPGTAAAAAILAMAEALGQETVAEGVETKEQADFLLRRACTIGQGYYYSPPLPAEEFDAFVRSYRPRPADRFAA